MRCYTNPCLPYHTLPHHNNIVYQTNVQIQTQYKQRKHKQKSVVITKYYSLFAQFKFNNYYFIHLYSKQVTLMSVLTLGVVLAVD